MSSPNQPYSFGNIQGAIAKAGEKAAGYFKKKSKEAAGDKAFNEKLYTMAFSHTLKGEAHKQQLAAEAEHHQTLLSHNAASATQMAKMAAPGSKLEMNRSGYKLQVPGEAPKPPKGESKKPPKEQAPSKPIKKSPPAPKNPKGPLARRAQIGRAMRKKGL